jgi:hypothetical protein
MRILLVLDRVSLSYKSVLAIKPTHEIMVSRVHVKNGSSPVRACKRTRLTMKARDVLDNLCMVGKHLGRRPGAEQTYINLALALVEWKPDTILDASTRWKKPH